MGHFGRKSGQTWTERTLSLLDRWHQIELGLGLCVYVVDGIVEDESNLVLVDSSTYTFVPSCPEVPVLRRERLCGNKWNVAPTGRKSDLLNRASFLT